MDKHIFAPILDSFCYVVCSDIGFPFHVSNSSGKFYDSVYESGRQGQFCGCCGEKIFDRRGECDKVIDMFCRHIGIGKNICFCKPLLLNVSCLHNFFSDLLAGFYFCFT